MRGFLNVLSSIENFYRNFYEFYIKPIFKVDNLNMLLFYSYVVFIVIGVFLIISGIFSLKKNRRIRGESKKITKEDIHHLINRFKPIRIIVDFFSKPLTLINYKSKAHNDLVTVIFLVFYGIFVYVAVPYINKYVFMWYTQLINFIIILFIPLLLLNAYLGILRNGIGKDLPDSFSEIFSAYRNNKKLKVALVEAVQYMPKKAKKEFNLLIPYLQSDHTFDYGLNLFEKRANNSLATLFCEIVRSSRFKNSDISKQLQHLAIKARGKQYLREKARRQLVWYKIFVALWLFSIPAIMDFVLKVSPEAYNFYSTVKGGTILTITIIVCVFSILCIHFLQKI